SQRHLYRARDLARAARCALPGAVRPPRRGDGAVSLVADIVIRRLGRAEYLPTLEAMRRFTRSRDDSTADELWLLEHPPVYTLGQGAAPVSVSNGIPVVAADRGGEVTYHGPGQAVLYTLIDLARRGIKVKPFVF